MNDWLIKYAGQVGQYLTIAILTWVGYSLLGLQRDVAVLQAKVSALEEALHKESLDIYHGADSDRDFDKVYGVLERYDRRILRLEDVCTGNRKGD